KGGTVMNIWRWEVHLVRKIRGSGDPPTDEVVMSRHGCNRQSGRSTCRGAAAVRGDYQINHTAVGSSQVIDRESRSGCAAILCACNEVGIWPTSRTRFPLVSDRGTGNRVVARRREAANHRAATHETGGILRLSGDKGRRIPTNGSQHEAVEVSTAAAAGQILLDRFHAIGGIESADCVNEGR